MTKVLFIYLVSSFLALNQASLISRCDLAQVLQLEDLDGFEGYSLSDCECHRPLPCHFSFSPCHVLHGQLLSLLFIFQSQVQKAAPFKKLFPTRRIHPRYYPSTYYVRRTVLDAGDVEINKFPSLAVFTS